MKYLSYVLEDGSSIYISSNVNERLSNPKDYEFFEEDECRNSFSKMEKTIKTEMKKIKPFIKEVLDSFVDSDNGPDEIELEFGIALSATLGVVITSGEMETNLKIKTIWKKEND